MAETFEYLNPVTAEKFQSDLSPVAINKIANEQDLDLEEYLARIDMDKRLKQFFFKIENVVLKVGEITVKIGKFIINFLADLAKQFENTVKGAIIGAALGFLFMQIPLIGWILGPIAITTFAFIGALAGLASDLVNLVTSAEERAQLKKMVISNVDRALKLI